MDNAFNIVSPVVIVKLTGMLFSVRWKGSWKLLDNIGSNTKLYVRQDTGS